jgi:hypothetical protein
VLTTKDNIAKKKSAMSGDVAKALARISSGLYVVTAAHNNARSAMVASWVSQVDAVHGNKSTSLPVLLLCWPPLSGLVSGKCWDSYLQASFEPLGLTIAVAKDRAIESLMQVSSGLTSDASLVVSQPWLVYPVVYPSNFTPLSSVQCLSSV